MNKTTGIVVLILGIAVIILNIVLFPSLLDAFSDIGKAFSRRFNGDLFTKSITKVFFYLAYWVGAFFLLRTGYNKIKGF
ncbi:hypothetical protein [Aquimarina rhabdastrellae]